MFSNDPGDRTMPEAAAHAPGSDARQPEDDPAALLDGEAYYRTIFDHADAAIWVQDPADGRFLTVSQTACDIAGYSVEEYKALGIEKISWGEPPYTAADAIAHMQHALETGGPHRFEWCSRHKEGRPMWVEVTLRRITMNGLPRLLATGRSIDDRKAAEAALVRANESLSESEAHFRRLIEHSYDLVQVLDAKGRIIYTGPSVSQVLGYTPEEIAGGSLDDFMHPDDLPAAAALVARVMANPGVPGSLQYRVRHRDGSWRWLEAYARTLSPTSADEGLIANARDVTDQYQAKEALHQAMAEAERAREQAERANRAKSEFLSRMSHELRTPLNSILGFAQVLEDLDLPPEYRNGIRHILNGGRHLLGLINEVLDIARIEADRLALSLEPVHLGGVMREAVDMVRPLAAARGVTVIVESGPPSERYVHADRQRLAQVLLNLLSNGVKYNRPQGRVWISCDASRGVDGAEWLAVHVRDEGSGIAAEHRDRLFMPFERLGAEHSGIEGTGLGLALSRHLARAMGGVLALDHTSSEGTAFRVELRPATDPLVEAGGVAGRDPSTAADAVSTATLLYIEDNLANLSLVQTILLPRPGWRLIPALQGGLGVELAVEHAPDVILLDLHLPDIAGREVLRLLRSDPRTAGTPVVVISADATPRTMQTLLAEGANAFLPKPLDVREFLPTLERFLARRTR